METGRWEGRGAGPGPAVGVAAPGPAAPGPAVPGLAVCAAAGGAARSGLWAAFHPISTVEAAWDNSLSLPLRLVLLAWCGAGALLGLGLGLAAERARRRGASAAAALPWAMGLLLPLPLLPALPPDGLTQAAPAAAIALITGIVAGWTLCVDRLLVPGPRLPRLSGRTAGLALGLMVVAAGAHYAAHGLARHAAWASNAWDMGLFDQLYSAIVREGRAEVASWRGRPEGPAFLGEHLSLIHFLVAPVYALRPGPETLLVVQAVVTASGAVPTWLTARARGLGPGPSLALAFAWLACPTLHPMLSFDFHEMAFVITSLSWLSQAATTRRLRWTFLFALLCLCSKEDARLGVAAVGLYLALQGQRRGLALAAHGAGWLVVAVAWVIPAFRGAPFDFVDERHADLIAPGSRGIPGLLLTVLSNPGLVASRLSQDPGNLAFALQLLVPLLGLPLLARWAWIVALPALAISFLSTYPVPRQLLLHHGAIFAPVMLLAATAGGVRLPAPRRRTAAVGLVLASGLLSMCLGFGQPLRAGRPVYAPTPTRFAEDARRLIGMLPTGGTVSASQGMVPQLPAALGATHLPDIDVDHVLVDLRPQANLWPMDRDGFVRILDGLLAAPDRHVVAYP